MNCQASAGSLKFGGMDKNRLEAFSDGVLAIIITITVLEMKVPHGSDWPALKPVLPVFLTYLLSFAYVGIYWNNHHHLLKATRRINAGIMWANLHLLFWLSLAPFVTGSEAQWKTARCIRNAGKLSDAHANVEGGRSSGDGPSDAPSRGINA